MKKINRRSFLAGTFGLATAGTLSACSSSQNPLPGPNLVRTGKNKTSSYQFPGLVDNDAIPDSLGVHRANTPPPSLEELLKPGTMPDRIIGRKNAKVTIVEYASPTCPICRAFHQKTFPAFKRKYIDTGKVKWILREFPIGHASGAASLALRCVPARQHHKLFEAYLRHQSRWVAQKVQYDKIYQVAHKAVGLSQDKFKKCMDDQALAERLKQYKQQGREFGVIGTPTFFIGGQHIRGFKTLQQMSEFVDPLLSGKTASIAVKK